MMSFTECHGARSFGFSPFYLAAPMAATFIFVSSAAAQDTRSAQELMCETAPDDCAAVHVCLEDGRHIEGYTTPGFQGRTWLGEVSTGEGCVGGIGPDGTAGLACGNMATRDVDEYDVTLSEAEDGTLTGEGRLEDGTRFEVIGSTDPNEQGPAPCAESLS